jgi:hypothetical protein
MNRPAGIGLEENQPARGKRIRDRADDLMRPVWLEATESFYKKLNRIANECDALEDGPPVVIAEMGAGAGQVAYAWFDAMYEGARDLGVAFTAIGLVTPDPASVDSVLKWADALQDRTDYLIVKNAVNNPSDFEFWDHAERAERFRRTFHPQVIEMEYRVPTFESAARNHGVTIGRVAARKTDVSDLQKSATVIRAQAYRRHIFGECDRVKDLLLP